MRDQRLDPAFKALVREEGRHEYVWAFGAVLHEMLTGRRAFDGEDVSDALAAVLESDPDWNALAGSIFPVRLIVCDSPSTAARTIAPAFALLLRASFVDR